jgi:hypothetical protein
MIELRAGGFKSSVRFAQVAIAAALMLSACGEGDQSWKAQADATAADTTAEAGYLAPPEVVGASFDGKAVSIEGASAPGAQVRIAPPRGEPLLVKADAKGRWQAVLTLDQPVHLYGLSMTQGARTAQAEGYVMVTAEGRVAQLRAGAGAVSLAPPSAAPRILAIDYDRDGGSVVSGTASPGAALSLRIGRAARGETKADTRGRFSISLPEPLATGSHMIEVAGEGGEDALRADITPAGSIGAGPYVGRRTPFGWRVDWAPPGGGVQTTLIFERPAA